MTTQDIEIITQQIGCDETEATKILEICNGDIVETILYLSRNKEDRDKILQQAVAIENKKSTVEKKIRELRKIVDEKDICFASFMDKQFNSQHSSNHSLKIEEIDSQETKVAPVIKII